MSYGLYIGATLDEFGVDLVAGISPPDDSTTP